MNKHIVGLSVVASFAVAVLGCSGDAEGDKAKVDSAQNVADAKGRDFKADLSQSYVSFIGYGVGKDHDGRFKFSEGRITVKDGQVTGGKFVVDVNSMETLDENSGKLRGHLLSPDFFDAAKYPTATFEITNVTAYTPSGTDTSVVEGANFSVSGNMTLKGVTKNVTFPAKVTIVEKESVTAEARFVIDRTWWEMHWGNDKSLGNKFISENVAVQAHVVMVDDGGLLDKLSNK